MWINPNHPNPPRQAAPTTAPADPLAVFDRGDGARLFVTVDEYEGRRYVRAQVWTMNRDGLAIPTKKVTTFRAKELAELLDALGRAREMIEAGDRPPTGPEPRQQARHASPSLGRGHRSPHPPPNRQSGQRRQPGRALPFDRPPGPDPGGLSTDFDELR